MKTRWNGSDPGWNRTRNQPGNLDPLLTLPEYCLKFTYYMKKIVHSSANCRNKLDSKNSYSLSLRATCLSEEFICTEV